MRIRRILFGGLLLVAVASIVLLQPGRSSDTPAEFGRSQSGAQKAGAPAEDGFDVTVGAPVEPVLTLAARDLPPFQLEPTLDREVNPRLDQFGRIDDGLRIPGGPDPLLDLQANAPPPSDRAFDTPTFNFAGQGYTFANPPDTVGDIGKDHYVQMVNGGGTVVSIYDKLTGALEDSFALTSLGGCATGSGDPIVLYDQLADRWMLSEFGSGNSLCVLVSQTSDPAGAYYSYRFSTPSFPDYPKYGIWPDAYYVSTNESSTAAYALDRANMLAGNAATSQRATVPDLSGFGFQALTPANWDGATPPPSDAPAIFMRHRDTEPHGNCADTGSQDCLELYAFDVDWTTPSNTTLTKLPDVALAEFDSDICGLTSFFAIAQPGSAKCTSTSLDPLREVVMFRLGYRNFGSHETLVGNLLTDVTGQDDTGIRWFELRKQGAGDWSLYQEGTYAPDSDSRWMGAVAMDSAGNIALGYNVSSSTTFPSLRYAGRLVSDPLGTLPQGEYSIVNGAGSNGSNRYGDYAAMGIDPVDDCTFWFTSLYNPTSQWATRIAAFRFDACGTPSYTLSTTPGAQVVCEPDDAVYTIDTSSISEYATPVELSASGNPGTASFTPSSVVPGGSSALTISGAGVGVYTFEVKGDSDGITRTNTVDLTVLDSVPGVPTLLAPADEATGVSTAPTLTWDPQPSASSYTVEIARDSGFVLVVDSATVTDTSYQATGLEPNARYHWRVSADNACGASPVSAANEFTTANSICSTPNEPIPDSGGGPLVDTITVTGSGILADLDVVIKAQHTYVGDLRFVLEHEGVSAELIDRPGRTTSGFGCSGADIDVVVNDEGVDGDIESQCSTAPAIFGDRVGGDPAGPVLASFDGADLAGEWTLTVTDNAGQDTGTLLEWCLVPAGDFPTPVTMVEMNATRNADDSVTVGWTTASEADLAGFNVLRADSAETTPARLNPALIASNATLTGGATYSYLDATLNSGAASAVYWVEAVNLDGSADLHGPIALNSEAPTSAALTALSGGPTMSLRVLATVTGVLLMLLAGSAMALRRATVHRR